MDICCIDKSSSAELSESLNSMFSWYEKSSICYAYIEDWQSSIDWADLMPLEPEEDEEDIVEGSHEDEENSSEEGYSEVEANDESSEVAPWRTEQELSSPRDQIDQRGLPDTHAEENMSPWPEEPSSQRNLEKRPLRWFTRGWTLQELTAPRDIEFYDAHWTQRGTKSEPPVAEHLSRITGISVKVLGKESKRELRKVCLGQRMSWAAYRETSRVEDVAYCLLGIFQVNMPMLYGEGDKAFLRLQEEILKSSTDLSIFAWTQNTSEQEKQTYRGILARHPREFYRSRNCRLLDTQFKRAEEITPTNRGLRFDISLFELALVGKRPGFLGMFYMDLGCLIDNRPQAIVLQRLSDFYVRLLSDGWMEISESMRRRDARTIYLARDMDQEADRAYKTKLAFGVKIQTESHVNSYILELVDAWPLESFDPLKSTFLASNTNKFITFAKFDIMCQTSTDKTQRRVATVMLIIEFDVKRLWTFVLEGKPAQEFETFIQSISDLDQTTARATLEAYYRALSKSFEYEMTVNDKVQTKPLRVSARRKIKIWRTNGRLVSRKAVKVELHT